MKLTIEAENIGLDRRISEIGVGAGAIALDEFAYFEAIPRIEGPTILCVQAGNVNTGAFDPIAEIEGPCVLDAQSHLVGWYERIGFEVTGPEYIEDGIAHTPMRLVR